MLDWKEEHAIVTALTSWLETTRQEVDAIAEDELDGDDQREQLDRLLDELDAGSQPLLAKLTALRHEVKLATKAMRASEERGEATLLAMQAAIDEFRNVKAQEERAARDAAAPLVEALIDLDESLRRTRSAVETARRRYVSESREQFGQYMQRLDELFAAQAWWRRKLCGPWYRAIRQGGLSDVQPDRLAVFDALLEGVEVVHRRLQRTMDAEGVIRMQCVGRPVDPHAMTVVEVVNELGMPPDTVCEELRSGYYWQGKPFRFAEVKAVGRSN